MEVPAAGRAAQSLSSRRSPVQHIGTRTAPTTFGDERLDRIAADDVTDWYDALAPGKETIRSQAYSLLRTIPYNPAHIRGAGNVKRAHKVRPASLQEMETIVEALPDRYKLMCLLAAWCGDALRGARGTAPR